MPGRPIIGRYDLKPGTPEYIADQAAYKMAEMVSIVLRGSIADTKAMREALGGAIESARAVMAAIPDDPEVSISPEEGDKLFSALEDLVSAVSKALNDKDRGDAGSVRIIKEMGAVE